MFCVVIIFGTQTLTGHYLKTHWARRLKLRILSFGINRKNIRQTEEMSLGSLCGDLCELTGIDPNW